MSTYTKLRSANYGTTKSNQSIGLTLYNIDGTTMASHTTSGVVEPPMAASSGVTTNPVTADTYVPGGTYNSQIYYQSQVLGTQVFVWYDGSAHWNMSTVLGTTGSNYFQAGSTLLGATWTGHGSATGTPVTVGTGCYQAAPSIDTTSVGVGIWDSPTGYDPYFFEIEPYITGATRTVVVVAGFGVVYTGLTIGFYVTNGDGTLYQLYTTSGVTEFASLGIYGTSITGLSLSSNYNVFFDAPSGLQRFNAEIPAIQPLTGFIAPAPFILARGSPY